MKTIFPSYYPKFRCIAGRCRHSCCIGWEIDIDEEALARYDDPANPLHDRLLRHIDRTDTPHFRLTADERCPFLRPDGLCEIICAQGEGALCQICADHPRFRLFFGGHEEVGLGLCCEGAGALILFEKDPVTWQTGGDDDPDAAGYTEAETAFLSLRRQVYQILQNRAMPVGQRMAQALAITGEALPVRGCGEWAATLRALERLDPAWDAVLDRLEALGETPLTLPETAADWEIPLENLAVYLVFRHLADCLWEIPPEADETTVRDAMMLWLVFCAFGTALLHTLFSLAGEGKAPARGEMTELCRLFSSEIEYSTDNVDALLDALLARL